MSNLARKFDGGAAFPIQRQENGYGNVLVYEQTGMSLRTYIATQVAAKLASQAMSSSCRDVTSVAVKLADALIKELNEEFTS